MDYRFAGRMLQSGKEQIFVTRGDALIAVRPGDILGGYVVRSISSRAIELNHPSSGYKESIAIPPGITVEQGGAASDSADAVGPPG